MMLAAAGAAATALLARAKDGEGVKSGPLGLAVILVLCVACYFLFKSMSKHMKRVREDFPADQPTTRSSVVPSDSSTGQPSTPTGAPSAGTPPPGDS